MWGSWISSQRRKYEVRMDSCGFPNQQIKRHSDPGFGLRSRCPCCAACGGGTRAAPRATGVCVCLRRWRSMAGHRWRTDILELYEAAHCFLKISGFDPALSAAVRIACLSTGYLVRRELPVEGKSARHPLRGQEPIHSDARRTKYIHTVLYPRVLVRPSSVCRHQIALSCCCWWDNLDPNSVGNARTFANGGRALGAPPCTSSMTPWTGGCIFALAGRTRDIRSKDPDAPQDPRWDEERRLDKPNHLLYIHTYSTRYSTYGSGPIEATRASFLRSVRTTISCAICMASSAAVDTRQCSNLGKQTPSHSTGHDRSACYDHGDAGDLLTPIALVHTLLAEYVPLAIWVRIVMLIADRCTLSKRCMILRRGLEETSARLEQRAGMEAIRNRPGRPQVGRTRSDPAETIKRASADVFHGLSIFVSDSPPRQVSSTTRDVCPESRRTSEKR